MTDLISRKALVTKLSKGYWDRELQQAKNDPCVIDAMIDWAIRIVNEMPQQHLHQVQAQATVQQERAVDRKV